MEHVYHFMSPIWISEEVHDYDAGVEEECYLHQHERKEELQDCINVEIEKENTEDGAPINLAAYLPDHLKPFVSAINIRVENYLATATVTANKELATEEIEAIKKDLAGQYSDGWGSGLAQTSVDENAAMVELTEWDEEQQEETTYQERATAYAYPHLWKDDPAYKIDALKQGEDANVILGQYKVKPRVKLIGQDGNIFSIAGRASSALKREGYRDEAAKMMEEITSSKSYHEALSVVTRYVDTY